MCFHSLSKVRLRGLNVAYLLCIELGDLVEFVTQTNVYLLEPLRAISNIRQSLWLLILDLIILVLLIKILIELCRKIGVTSTNLPSRLVSRFGISHPHHLSLSPVGPGRSPMYRWFGCSEYPLPQCKSKPPRTGRIKLTSFSKRNVSSSQPTHF